MAHYTNITIIYQIRKHLTQKKPATISNGLNLIQKIIMKKLLYKDINIILKKLPNQINNN